MRSCVISIVFVLVVCCEIDSLYAADCPPDWVHHGDSCYHLYSDDVTAKDANDTCIKDDAHLVSLDTLDEKKWIFSSGLVKSGNVWTSLNDVITPGRLVWEDGTHPVPSVIKWEPKVAGGGDCIMLYVPQRELTKTRCNNDAFPGCQYKSSTENCVGGQWKYHDGYCYLAPYTIINPHNSDWYLRDFDEILTYCEEKLGENSNPIDVTMLKIDKVGIFDVYKHTTGAHIWTGLKETERGVYEWADGTAADMSLFESSHHTQTWYNVYGDPNECTLMNDLGELRKVHCHKCKCAQTLCEKELSKDKH